MSDSGDSDAAGGGDTVCGVVVRAWPARTREVKRHLAQMAGVEVHAAGEDARLIVTVEGGDEGEVADAVLALHRLEGVLSASLVYHHHEGPGTAHGTMKVGTSDPPQTRIASRGRAR